MKPINPRPAARETLLMDDTRKYLEVDHRMVGWCEKAVTETFRSLFNITVELRDVQIELAPLKGQQVTGILPFVQSSLEGALALSFSEGTLENLASDFYRMPSNELSDELLIGTVSETTSIVFNLVKEVYNQNGFKFQSSYPMVIVGGTHRIFSTFPPCKLTISFDSQYGSFTIEVSAAQGR